MPTYEYRCPQGHDFEKFYSRMSEAEAVLECPECGQPAERRISGGAGLLFKGSGFYLTDYGKNAHRGSAPDKKADKKEAGAAPELSGGSKGGESGSGGGATSGESGAGSSGKTKSSGEGGSGGKGSSSGGTSTGGKKE